MLGQQLDLVASEVFSNLNVSRVLCCSVYLPGQAVGCHMTRRK